MILYSTKTYAGIMCCCLGFSFGAPLLFPIRTLPLDMWFFGIEEELQGSPRFELVYFMQSFTSVLPCITGMIPLDMLFIAMVGCAVIQFDMLRHEFKIIGEEELNEKEAFDRQKELIKQHQVILK